MSILGLNYVQLTIIHVLSGTFWGDFSEPLHLPNYQGFPMNAYRGMEAGQGSSTTCPNL